MKLEQCPVLMVQGTTSDAGKSTLVTGLCRLLARTGVMVAPFKPQNMALNSAVTEEGGEIGRAQAVQAQACGIAPSVHMNPVLIKPSSDTAAQIIIQGRASAQMTARNYHDYKPLARTAVMESFNQLSSMYSCVIVEGAGSPAEINLREGDIANMGFAEAVDCPVIIVADIDKGGVFAHLVGTLALLAEAERARVIGFVINRFRGDKALLQPGLDWLEEHTGKPVLAVLPYLEDFYLQAEDGISTQQENAEPLLNVVVPVLTRISNHTDFDSLRLHPNVNFQFVSPRQAPPACDLIILPGSKAVCDDLAILKQAGWSMALQRHLRYGGKVLGICGGYQMLGKALYDPDAIEGAKTFTKGFDLLPVATTYSGNKELAQHQASLRLLGQSVEFIGYEIHHGRTELLEPVLQRPVLRSVGSEEGCLSNDEAVLGTYFHGLLDSADSCDLVLAWAGFNGTGKPQQNLEQLLDAQIERLADALLLQLDQAKLQQALAAFYAARNTQSSPPRVV